MPHSLLALHAPDHRTLSSLIMVLEHSTLLQLQFSGVTAADYYRKIASVLFHKIYMFPNLAFLEIVSLLWLEDM